jgi:hypothetical protein
MAKSHFWINRARCSIRNRAAIVVHLALFANQSHNDDDVLDLSRRREKYGATGKAKITS